MFRSGFETPAVTLVSDFCWSKNCHKKSHKKQVAIIISAAKPIVNIQVCVECSQLQVEDPTFILFYRELKKKKKKHCGPY